MSGPEPRKAEDRLLEDFFAGGDEVTRAYRSGAPVSAPPVLDERILKIARDELGRPLIVQQGGARRRRWRGALAMAATLVLGLGLGLNLQQEQSPQQALVLAPAADIPQQPAAPGPRKSEQVRADAPAAAPPPPQPQPPPSAPMPSAAVTSPAPSAVAQPAPEAQPEESSAAPELRQRRALRKDQAPLGAAAAGSNVAPLAEMDTVAPGAPPTAAQPPETPQAWLGRIRALRDAGHVDQARRELQAFRQRYPQRQLLPDLQALEKAGETAPPR